MRILITSIVDLKKTSHNRLHQFIRHLSKNHEITVFSINDSWKANQTDASLYMKGVEDTSHDVNVKYFNQWKISPILQEVISIATLNRILKKDAYKEFDVHLNYNKYLFL